uniref:Uncharacterized protein n=1 Tax=Acrobeloides nanus TaxID=290746 RepID=A0A914EDV1_9BILA
MINIVNLPSTPRDFYATPTKHIQTFKPISENPEDINDKHAELLQMRKEIKRSSSSPSLFEHPKMASKVHYLPDGRKALNGKFEQSQPDILWAQLFKRSLSRKIEDMIESPMEVPPGYESVKLLASSDEKLVPQSSLDFAESMVASNSEPNFSQSFPQKSDACKWLLREPNSESNHEELKR